MTSINLVSRSQWRATARRGEQPLRVDPRGVKIHYVGGTVSPVITEDHGACLRLVRTIQHDHMANRHWVDIGYTMIACPHHQVIMGRGPHILPAANGAGLNAQHYAVLALVGDAGLVVPPAGMLHALVDAIEWLRDQGAGREVKRHKDGYDTTCPGAFLSAWVGAGARRPDTPADRPPDPPPWPGRILEPPMRGTDVELWQRRMRARGWRVTVDGIFGPQSAGVAKAFQREKGLKATGRVNRTTWEAAWKAPVT